MNKKQIGWILLIVSLFGIITSSVLIIIGSFSTYLITNIIRYILIGVLIIFTILLSYSIYLLYKFRRRRNLKKWKVILFNTLISLYAVGCSCFLFILYGPMDTFRDWLITTAMMTMHHQHYCKWFYSDKIIDDVMSKNYIIQVDDDTDASLIDHEISHNYKDEYEREILEHEEGQIYKIINFEVNGQKAYLAAIYDPSKISVGVTKWLGNSGQYATDMAKERGAVLAINGGGFLDPGYNSNGANPIGVTISHGKVITNRSTNGGIIGFNNDNVLVLKRGGDAYQLVKEGIRDAVTMTPLLIVNGKASFISGNGGWGYAARTAIGQRADGVVLFLVVDSNATRSKGASMVDLTNIMQRYGAINAANLDGGTSSVMVVNGEIINDPIDSALRHRTRGIPTIFYVKE